MQEYYIPNTITAEKDSHYLKQFITYKKIYVGVDLANIKPFEGIRDITIPKPTKYHLCSFCGKRRDIIHSCTYNNNTIPINYIVTEGAKKYKSFKELCQDVFGDTNPIQPISIVEEDNGTNK